MSGGMSGGISGRTHSWVPGVDCRNSAVSISDIASGLDRQAFTVTNPYRASNGVGAVEKNEFRNLCSISAILATLQHQVHKVASREPALLVGACYRI